MLVHLRSNNFNPEYLKYIDQDPVHALTAQRNTERRCQFDRNIFFWIENNMPTAVLCVAYINGLTDCIDDILDVNSPVCLDATHAIFYSVFRTDTPSSIQNTGATLIRESAQWIKANMPQIKNYVTMSPIPNLSAHFPEPPKMDAIIEFLSAQKDPVAKFHIRNGARILRIIPNADASERRQAQSYSNMVNYDYTQNFIDPLPAINN
jgi:malonyl-CoA decarboxylase